MFLYILLHLVTYSLHVYMMYVWGYACHSTPVGVREQLAGAGSLLLPRGSQGPNSGLTLGANVFTLMSHLTSFNVFHYAAPNITLVGLSAELLTKVTKY